MPFFFFFFFFNGRIFILNKPKLQCASDQGTKKTIITIQNIQLHIQALPETLTARIAKGLKKTCATYEPDTRKNPINEGRATGFHFKDVFDAIPNKFRGKMPYKTKRNHATKQTTANIYHTTAKKHKKPYTRLNGDSFHSSQLRLSFLSR